MDETGLLATPRLTAEQLRGWDLPRVMRGYDVQATDEMRQAAMEEILSLTAERGELERAVQVAMEDVRQAGLARDAMAREMQDAGPPGRHVPAHSAPVSANDAVSSANGARPSAHGDNGQPARVLQQAQQVLRQAQQRGEDALSEAQARARQVSEDAERQHRQLVADAQIKADALMQETQAKANALMQERMAEVARQAADILAQAPAEAQRRLTVIKAMGTAWEAHLRTLVSGITDSLDSLDQMLVEVLADPAPA